MSGRPIAMLFVSLIAAAALLMPSPARCAAPQARPIYTAISYDLPSKSLGDTRQINVWIPPDYAQSVERYSVVYLLDGGLDQDFHHIAGLAQLGSLSFTYGPVIIVGVQTRDRQRDLTPKPKDPRYQSAFPASGGAESFRTFLADEVIPFVERTYRTGSRRAVMGESLAGLFVVDTLLSRPQLFHDYVAISPSLWWDDRQPMRVASRRLQGVRPIGRRLYLAVADEGGTMQDGIDLLRSALAALPAQTVAVMYSDRSASDTHSTIYHSAAERALRWLYATPPYVTGPTPWYMIDGANPVAPSGDP